MFDNEYIAEAGEMFYQFVQRVQGIMKCKSQRLAHIIFNDIRICITVDSRLDDICTIYDLKCKIKRWESR